MILIEWKNMYNRAMRIKNKGVAEKTRKIRDACINKFEYMKSILTLENIDQVRQNFWRTFFKRR